MGEALQLISSSWGWVLYFVCAVLIGMSKTGIQNIGTLAVPLFAFLFGAKYSTGIVLILLCIADLVAVIYYRKEFLWKEIKKLLPAALFGLVVGLLLGNYINDKLFKLLIGACIIVGVGIMIWLEKTSQQTQDRLTKNRWYSPIFGFILGFSTMIGNAAGPALSVYMLSKRLNKISFAATSAWFIMLLNFTKIPLQAFIWHNLTWSGFYLNLFAIPFILLGGFVGIKIVKILPEKEFRILIMTLVVISAILLIVL
ncbi:sulfite exporter TauE/SafE family protein [Sphingobacterium chuzhouense]|uniref:Probable membrane transporter protein n=1 Tax=Sphingobacterium chuzhouense TaxID=1742264 RepID=A0ABR7XUK7_9SPHI|nr:sulfite exporter TauE/SafE family protein [Sphingobacterium chuzhouense]MBD1422735.1 sulfite exporter TauE/SafE family protein [Sphingobacterium chuzhouense]